MKRIIRLVAVAIMAIVLIITLVKTFKKQEYPRPSNEFYVNDFAHALLPGSSKTFLSEGERLYDLTKDSKQGGAQIVVATMFAKNEPEADKIDRTRFFRQWRIGENDMGLLILLIFIPSGEDMVLYRSEIEIGYRMESYITAAKAGYLIDNCLYNPEWDDSIDMGLGEMYYELLKIIYVDAYGYESFSYDMENFRDFIINYEGDYKIGQSPLGLIDYILSPYSSVWSKIFAAIALIMLGSGGGILILNKGKGGRSGGYGAGR